MNTAPPQARSDGDWRPVDSVANHFGLVVMPHTACDMSIPRWDGRVIRVSYPIDAFHEIAHFQLAPVWRRHRSGFGLGMEPNGYSPPQVVPEKRCEYEEELASLLGLIWAADLGYAWRDEAADHNWSVGEEKHPSVMATVPDGFGAVPHVDKLAAIGVLTEDHRVKWPPVVVRRWALPKRV